MCFGGKADKEEDTPAPRPSSMDKAKKGNGSLNGERPRSVELREQPGQQQQSHSSQQPPQPAHGSGYAPPSGPPPGHDASHQYAPPPGPPRSGHDEQYGAPPGPPPSHAHHGNQYAPPPGPPPSSQDQYAPPPGPPPGNAGHDYAPPAGPPPGQHNDFTAPSGPPPGHETYAPPPGPPPARGHDEYAPPSGPPPGHGSSSNNYAPPPGPPPSHHAQDQYAPPPGPPPASDDWAAPPPGPPPQSSGPKHDWEAAVPDTSLFPPPPAIFSGFDASPATNATEEEANHGEAWCQQYPLVPPMALDHAAHRALETSNIRLMEPVGFNGKLEWMGLGHWQATTAKNTPDRCMMAYPPLYLVNEHQPLRTGSPRTIYYEVKLREDSRAVTIGMGFTALPYPSFRMPGWHRGSLAIHGDDGHRYINDRWGGKTFTEEFRRGDTYGIGMTLSVPTQEQAPADVAVGRPHVEIFFTRNGVKAGSWDLHEETDAEQDLPVTGLEGFHDLSAAVGTYDGLSFEVIFDPSKWMYKGLW